MVKVYFVKKWTVNSVTNDSEGLYIFGDNNIKKGCGGQAIIRYLPNAIGIPTKKYPNNESKSYYTDDDYDNNCNKINIAIDIIKTRLDSKIYNKLVLPEDGLGTGLARLPIKAPRTYNYLIDKICSLVGEMDKESLKKIEELKGYQQIKLNN
uniref:DUF7831 domain-containing protein n=1 Tax=viral metagenome TaxID=1070528 RepID=A0A6C0E828_9ZZZZ